MERGTPLYIALENGHTDIAEYLVDDEADVNISDDTNKTLVHKASEFGHAEIGKYLVGHGADVNISDICRVMPLSDNSEIGHLEIVENLVGHGQRLMFLILRMKRPYARHQKTGTSKL